MPSYIFSTRSIANGTFTNDPGAPGQTRYLRIPDGAALTVAAEIPVALWLNEIQQLATAGGVPQPADAGAPGGDVLIYLHGYNHSQADMLARHRQLQDDLNASGWAGIVVSYDWPSEGSALSYLEDRRDAKATAAALVQDGIRLLAATQRADCRVAVHVLAHSMGAFLLREAFDHADDRLSLRGQVWGVGQCVLIAGDVSSDSLGASDSSVSIYRHSQRLTNYSNGADEVLQVSRFKNGGASGRVGRVGLPEDAPPAAVNVDCTAYWQTLREDRRRLDLGAFCHSWYFGDLGFTRDLAHTLDGGLDRAAIPGRTAVSTNRFSLTP